MRCISLVHVSGLRVNPAHQKNITKKHDIILMQDLKVLLIFNTSFCSHYDALTLWALF